MIVHGFTFKLTIIILAAIWFAGGLNWLIGSIIVAGLLTFG